MKKYNIKKYIKYFLLFTILLMAQQYLNTLIPMYTARNVDIGIVNRGVEFAVFDNITYETSKKLNANILSNYTIENNIYTLKKQVNKSLLEKETISQLKADKKEIIKMVQRENEKLGINNSSKFIINNSLKMLAIATISAIFVVSSNFSISYTCARISKDLREKIFKHISTLTDKDITDFGVSSLITRSTNDITVIQTSLNIIFKMCMLAGLMFFFSSYQAYKIEPRLMPVLIAFSILVIIVIVIALILILPRLKKRQKIMDRLNTIVREILTGKRVIRAFEKTDFESAKFDNINKEHYKLNKALAYINAFINPLFGFLLNISASVVLYYASIKLNNFDMQIGSILAFSQYAITIMVSFLLLGQIFIVIPNALISFERIDEVLSKKSSVIKEKNKLILDNIDKIEFKNITVRYEGSESNILDNVSFTLEKNESLGIIGSTGSGKTTIIKLLLRFINKTSGHIYINGIDIENYDIESIRNRISYTPQTAKLLSGTVAYNIAYKSSLDENRIKWALNMAKADFFESLDYVIEQNASNLSGGQKQRLQIARSIYKDSDLMLFDDSFSALDNITEKELRENLKTLDNKKIIVSQKIASIINADKILVLNEGKVVGLGNSEHLLENCFIYKQIYDTQVGGVL